MLFRSADVALPVPAELTGPDALPPEAAEVATPAAPEAGSGDGGDWAPDGVPGVEPDAAAVEPADAPLVAPVAEATGGQDAGVRRPVVGGRMTPAARQFHNALVVTCWRDNPPANPRPVTVTFVVTYDQYGAMRTFDVRGDVSDQFKRCLGLRGQSFRFQPLPDEATVSWRAVLRPEP